MDDSWKELIGNFPKLMASNNDTQIGRWMVFWVTKLKDDLADASDDNRYIEFETKHQALHPKTKKDEEKYTWHGTRLVTEKDKDGKSKKGKDGKVIKKEEEGDWPVRKFVSISTDVKRMFVYLLNRYVFEAHNAYAENNNTFDADNVLTQVYEHSESAEEPSIAAMIIKSTDDSVIDVDQFLSDNEFSGEKYKAGDLHKFFHDRILDYFKNGDTAPSKALEVLVTQFIKFMKLFSIYSMNSLWEKKETVGRDFFFKQLRNIYVLVRGDGLTLDRETEDNLDNFVKACVAAKKEETAKNKKKKEENKKKKEENKAEAGDDDEDVDDADLEDAVDEAAGDDGDDDDLDDADEFDDMDDEA